MARTDQFPVFDTTDEQAWPGVEVVGLDDRRGGPDERLGKQTICRHIPG